MRTAVVLFTRDLRRVFTPYHRAWRHVPPGDPLPAPRAIRLPAGVGLPSDRRERLVAQKHEAVSPRALRGGETAGRERARRWLRTRLATYGDGAWVAGTGVDTGPNRVFNPTAQATKLDPDGVYQSVA